MKVIAYVLPTYPMPSQTFIRREIAAMEARGWTVHRLAMRRFGRELAEAADRVEEGRTEYVLEAGPIALVSAFWGEALTRPRAWARTMATAARMGRRSEKGLFRHLVYLVEACYLRRRLARCRADHVHVHFGTNAATVAMLCRLLGGPPYSMTIHGPEEFDAPGPLALGEKVRHAAFVVAISHFTRSQLLRWASAADWPRIHVVRCGLDEVFLGAPGTPVTARPRLVSVGRLAEQKGQLLLVEAAARLRERVPDFELILVGDGPLRDELEARIARLGLEDRVRITGFLDNQAVRRELEAARALVLPSFAEGLPVVIMEALALGRPVIATFIAGVPELVEPGQSGWLVPAGAVEPLIEAMAEALTADPRELDAMGRAGAVRASAQHDAAVEAAKLAALLGEPDADTAEGRPTRPGASLQGAAAG